MSKFTLRVVCKKSKEDVMKTLMDLAELVIKSISSQKRGGMSYEDFEETMSKKETEINRILNDFQKLEQSDFNNEEEMEICEMVATDVEYLFISFTEKGKKAWNNQQKRLRLVKTYIVQYVTDIEKFKTLQEQ